ncbi:MAG TPA: amidohydrolase family protein, partial [Thermoanaerobaculia bacterium]|nr:amidohydrolase family protein [Thermoanaerobaculia bacterium]
GTRHPGRFSVIIDFHNHFFPEQYIDALRKSNSRVQVTTDPDGNPVLHYPGDYNIAVRGHRDIAYRVSVLDEYKVDRQVLSLTTPGTHVEEPATAVKLARLVNDCFAGIARDSKRFIGIATLPLSDPAASAKELDRACRQLGFCGAMVFSNINGVALADQRFWPVWEKANDIGAVIHIHPTSPVGVEAMQEFWLMPLVGFPMDTTLAAAKLVFSGVVKRFPRIRWVLGHLGGAIPYLVERLDRGFHAFKECRENIDRPPSGYLREFYYDSVNFDGGALQLAIDFAGANHVLAGSDYPHQIGSLRRMIDSINALAISDAEKQAIFGGNAARLLVRD